ncbi:DUF2853 family protein [Thermaurantiacus sp.]
MAEDWSINVRKYAPDADESVIQAIVRHLGIALRSRDASLVSFTDPSELETVRESWLKKKLGLTDPDDALDAAIAKVGERMKDDATKNRVTVYYLLAEMFGKLGLLGGGTAAAATSSDPEPAAGPASAAGSDSAAAGAADPGSAGTRAAGAVDSGLAAAAAAAPAALSAAPAAAAAVSAPAAAAMAAAPAAAAVAAIRHGGRRTSDDDGIIKTGVVTAGVLGLGILGAAILGSQIGGGRPEVPPPVSPRVDGPVVATPAIPTGSGVLAETIEGKPALNVYFGTAEREVAPLGAEAAPLKAYLDANPDERLSVSGYVDPRGDAAFNAQLAKDRAENTRAALVAAGIPEDRIDLDKPADIVGADASLAEGRRVTVRVKSAGTVVEPAVVERTQATP